jgi:hypothetical protein
MSDEAAVPGAGGYFKIPDPGGPMAFRQRHGVGFAPDGVPDCFRELDPFGEAELGRFGEEALGHASDFTPPKTSTR